MEFNPITPEILAEIINVTGSDHTFFEKDDLFRFSHDETEDLHFYPEVVALPKSAEEVSELVKICSNNQIPITPRGAGTSLSGGALPLHGGLVICMERMNQLIEIDERNLQATAEAGLITQVLMTAVEEKGLFYPVDPASKGSCFIGGNVSHSSGGPQVVKYGTIREYILNLQVVLPSGEIIWTGANTLKFSSGYNLTQLFIGSEGTLGIVTKIVVKLIPKPAENMVMLASFPSNESACEAVSAIFRAGQTPSSLEFIERKGIEWVMEHDSISFDLVDGIEAFLLIQVDGDNQDSLFQQCEKINVVLEENGCTDVLLADTTAQKEALWSMRRLVAVSVKSNSIYKEEDTVVPRAELPKLIKGIKEIGKKYGFESVCYGHAGDGNLHVNIIKSTMTDEEWNTVLPHGITEIFNLTVALGGTISGEHGIGYVQKGYLPLKFSATHIDLMKGIKKVFDPKGIMNPGKIF
ncbi:FAD-binding oxidoreductase [Albibacterium bauzanense]|uniref:Glycolate oxidase n=1 Tax=Albibacterium bauzanense TaxID=653929 RepID=A0A4R1LVA3_9SPHI|nr:FAD-linked oxidase C-terminal domain-containing protein [Albibacterium bauzanense]TCK83326.1 glycolate oxidase [Albibacterium bauzanense]